MLENETRNVEALDLVNQAELLIQSAKYDEAAKKLDEAMDVEPMIWEIYKNYGDLHMAKDEYEAAKKSYRQAMRVEKMGELFFLYGNACFMNGDETEGIENYNLAIANGYDTEDVLYFTGLAYEHLNDPGNAIRYFFRASQKNPARPDFKLKMVELYIQMNDLKKAEERVDDLIATSPELFDGYHIKNLLLTSAERYEEAEKAAALAVERFPEDVDLYMDYTRVFANRGDHDKALEMIGNAKKMKYFEIGIRDFCLLEAQLYASKGDMEQAIASCQECIDIEKAGDLDGEVRFTKMNLHFAMKQYELALEQAEAILIAKQADGFYHAALYYKARCLKELGRADESAEAYDDALVILRMASLEHDSAVDTYLYRAMAHKDMGQLDKALELLDFIDDLNMNLAQTHLIRSEIYLSQNNELLQKQELEKAYELQPELRPEE